MILDPTGKEVFFQVILINAVDQALQLKILVLFKLKPSKLPSVYSKLMDHLELNGSTHVRISVVGGLHSGKTENSFFFLFFFCR